MDINTTQFTVSLIAAALIQFFAWEYPNVSHRLTRAGIAICLLWTLVIILPTWSKTMAPVWAMSIVSLVLALGAFWYWEDHRATAASHSEALAAPPNKEIDATSVDAHSPTAIPEKPAGLPQKVPPHQSRPRPHLSEARPRAQDVIKWICGAMGETEKDAAVLHECVPKAAAEVADAARNGKINIWIHHKGGDAALTKLPIDIWQFATLECFVDNHIGPMVYLVPQYRGGARMYPDPKFDSEDAAMIAPYQDFDVMLVEDAQKVEALWPLGTLGHVAR